MRRMHRWAARSLLLGLLALTATGCEDEPQNEDLAMVVDGGGDASIDLRPVGPDLKGCQFGTFLGLQEVDTVQTFECPCGCLVDGLVGAEVSTSWSVVASANGLVTGRLGQGVSLSATSFGVVEFAGISSLSGTYPFYLEGDFSLSLDYELGELSPDGRLRLITQTLGGPPTGTFIVERVRGLDGVHRYAGLTGEVAAAAVTTDKQSGTLTIERVGADLTAYADGQLLGKLSGGSVARMHIIITAGLKSCAVDAGSCVASATVKNLRLKNGTLINKR